jgi:3-hydroxybutyryl-CoA dehydrogenase
MANSSLPKIGVIGAGTMGSGIALVALYAGAQVVLQDTAQPVLDKAADYIKKFLEKKGQGDRFANVKFTQQLEELSDAGVVIEAAPEQLELKRELFRKLEATCAPDAILATNTSTLSVTAVAAAIQRPGRVAGMHFFNPAPLLPLVEVVRA